MSFEGMILSNRYEIMEKIGNGGMATVYKAKDKVLNRYVAVKILRDEYTTDIEFIKRFNSEAQSAASLTHPNIVSIYDVGNEDNVYYIVMELVQGKTLKEIIVQDGALPWKWSANVAIQIASALDVAHKHDIIHRDIKPHNIIITEDGVAKVTDFGIAKAVSNSTITAFGITIGSVHYFSPEHARGGYTDAKSDLYSLGVVMYEMVTGKVPFDADTPVSVALKHIQQPAIEPIKVDSNIPIAVNNIIMRALEKDANIRYSSASEMIADLTACLKKPEDTELGATRVLGDMPTQRVPILGNKPEVETQKEEKKNKIVAFYEKHKILRAFTFIILAIAIFAVVMVITINATTVKAVQIINLVGMTKEEAEAELNKIKVNLEIAGEEYDPEIPEGSIISQDPKYRENFSIKQKSTIKVIVSKGKETADLTKLAGLTKDEAIAKIRELGLIEEIIEEKSDTVQEGIVIKQDPLEGTTVDAKSTVKIYVSIGTGIRKVNVPDLLGYTEASAKTLLETLGLKMSVKYEEDSTKEDGVVLSQDKSSGTSVDEGTTVNLVVNKISPTITGTIYINVKKISGGYDTTDNTIDLSDKAISVYVYVDGKEKWSSNSVDKNNTALPVTISGKGFLEIEVKVGGNTRTKTMDLKNQTTLNID